MLFWIVTDFYRECGEMRIEVSRLSDLPET